MIYPIQFYQIHTELNIFPWKVNIIEEEPSIILGQLYGLCIKYKNNTYILTTAHKININAKLYYNYSELKILFINKDLDVCILENNLNLDYTDKIKIKLNIEENSIFINTFLDNKIILNFNKIIEENISLLGPQILLIECSKHIDSIKIKEGMSGLPIFDKDNYCIGLISRNEGSIIQLIPLINFIHIIENNNNNLCSFYELISLENNNLKITKKSNKYYHTKKFKSDTFKKKDIILKVDNLEIKDGYIYSELLDIYISPYIYILLNKKDKERINFIIERENEIFKKKIYIKSYNKLQCINNDDITKYYSNNSIIIYQLNINLLIYYLYNKLEINKKIPQNFIENINMNNKIFMKENI